MNKNPAVARGG